MDREQHDDESWVEYKRRKMHFFVDQGYSVTWTPDRSNWINIYSPVRMENNQSELRAMIKCYGEPSKYGIEQGRISKLCITQWSPPEMKSVPIRPSERVTTLYNYDRGLDVYNIKPDSAAAVLLTMILKELN